MNVDTNLYETIKLNQYGNVSIMGNLADLDYNVPYKITGIETKGKYGITYKVISCNRNKPASSEETHLFLRTILTKRQADALYVEYPNIIDMVLNDEPIDLSVVKGIGEKSFKRIRDKIIADFKLIGLINEFKGMLSITVLRKLYEKYPSIEVVRKKVLDDPYTFLCDLSGIGFKTADEMLLNFQKNVTVDFGYDLKASKQRCVSCITYLLKENENNGSTKLELVTLLKQVKEMTPECSEHLVECVKDEKFYYHVDESNVPYISIRDTYETEKYIYDRIMESMNCSEVYDINAEKYRQCNRIQLTNQQLNALDMLNKNNFSILSGSAGCVDCDTEYFNGDEWIPISKYTDGDKVLQYNEDGTAELVIPERYIKQKAEYLWHFRTKNGLDQCLSLNHMCYYETRWGVRKKEPFSVIKEKQESKTGFTGKFYTTFKYSGKGIPLSDEEIRLMVAVFADGCFINKKENKNVKISIKKQRKIDRLKMLLNDCKKIYKATVRSDGYINFYFHVNFYAKHFPKNWYNCSQHQFEVIADEVMYWDGTFSSRERFTTTNRDDANFIQFAFSIAGYRASIAVSDRRGEAKIINGKKYVRKSLLYVVTRTKKNMPSMSYETRTNRKFGKTIIEPYKTKDGYEYCFTVPSHLLVLRRNDRIFITGNCGKSQSVKSIINMLEDNNKTYKLFAPTGKAAKTLSAYVDRPCETIHRGLGYIPPDWTYNENHKLLCDVLIIDEISMTDIFLFKRVLAAINFSTTKLLIIGDPAQLPSVACGNLLHDLLSIKEIPCTKLTEVFRYGDGGLMKVATDVRNSIQYLTEQKENKEKMKAYGTNKDYTFINANKDEGLKYLITIYKKVLETYKSNEVTVLSCYKKGDYGCIRLNEFLKPLANPHDVNDNHITVKGQSYYIGDIVMQKVNNRDGCAVTEEEQFGFMEWTPYEEGIFIANGETGEIIDIKNDDVIINFNGINIRYTREDMQNIVLAYAYTVHSSQGSQNKIIILFTPSSHAYMLNSNIIYVGLTRMQEKVFHIGDLNTVNRAILKKENFERNTWLKEFKNN